MYEYVYEQEVPANSNIVRPIVHDNGVTNGNMSTQNFNYLCLLIYTCNKIIAVSSEEEYSLLVKHLSINLSNRKRKLFSYFSRIENHSLMSIRIINNTKCASFTLVEKNIRNTKENSITLRPEQETIGLWFNKHFRADRLPSPY